MIRNINNTRIVRRVISEGRYDAVLIANIRHLSRLPVEAALESGLPIFRYISDKALAGDYGRRWNWMERFLMPWTGLRGTVNERQRLLASSGAILTSSFIEDHFDKWRLLGPKRTVIYPCLDLTSWPVGQPQDQTILYAGQWSTSKGTLDLFQAFKTVASRFPGATMTLTGHGDPEITRRVEEFARDPTLRGKLTIAGHVSDLRLRQIFSASSIFVLPSRLEEALSFSLAEAMASGLAIVSTATGGNAEILSDSENALVVAAGDSKALGNALSRLLGDTSLRRSLATSARVTAERLFDVHKATRQLHDFLISGTT